MALVRVNKANAGNTANQATYTTAAFNLTTGDVVIAFLIHNVASGTCGAHTIGASGTTLSGISWTPINSALWGASSLDRMTAWWGLATSDTSGVLVWSIAGTTPAGACYSVFAYSGADIGNPVSAEVVLNDTDAIAGPVDTSALTGALTVWGAARNSNSTDGSHTGATIIHNPAHASPTRNLITMEEAGENSPSVTWPGGAMTARIVAFKVREAAFPFAVNPASLTATVEFGTPTLAFGGAALTVTPASLTVPVAFTTPLVAGQIATTAFTVAVSFGTVTVATRITTVAFTTPVSFGTPTLIVPLKVTPMAHTFYGLPGDPTLAFASGVSFSPLSLVFLADLSQPILSFKVTTTAATATVSFGTPTLRFGVATTGLSVAVTVGSPTLVIPGATLTPLAFTVTPTVGSPSLVFTGATLTPSALAVAVTFGSPTLAIRLAPVAFTVPVTFPTPTVSGRITTTALSVTTTLGTPTAVIPGATLTPLAHTVTVSFGNTVLSIPGAPITIAVNALVVAPTFGTPTLSFVAGITVTPASLTRTITYGTPTVRSVITIPSLATFTAFGTPTLVAGTAAQTLLPFTDIGTDAWTTDTGATTGLAAALADVSESNYIQSEFDPVDSPYVVALSDGLDPAVGTGHVVSWSHRNPGPDDLDLTVELRQGYVSEASRGALKAQWTETAIPATFTTVTKTLSVGEADTITDYTDLFLRFSANKPEAGFDPASISGLTAWYDASTLALADGADVTSWPDLSGSGHGLTPLTSGKPTYQTSELNGLGVVRYGGVAEEHLVTSVGGDYRHFFLVAKYDLTTFASYNGLLGGDADLVLVGSSGTDIWYSYLETEYRWNGVVGTMRPAPMGVWGQMGVTKTAGWLNLKVWIGSDRGFAGRQWDGDVAEVIGYDRILSDSERLQVEAYLADKWGV